MAVSDGVLCRRLALCMALLLLLAGAVSGQAPFDRGPLVYDFWKLLRRAEPEGKQLQREVEKVINHLRVRVYCMEFTGKNYSTCNDCIKFVTGYLKRKPTLKVANYGADCYAALCGHNSPVACFGDGIAPFPHSPPALFPQSPAHIHLPNMCSILSLPLLLLLLLFLLPLLL